MTSDEHSLRVQRTYAAEPERVFDGFLGAYDDPRPKWVLRSDCDPRVDGAWDLEFRPPGLAAFTEHRVFTALDRPRRLAYRAQITPAGAPAYSTDVEVGVEPVEDGTSLTLAQNGFPDAATRDAFRNAWPDVLAMIADRIG